jgi:hypothetical protein
MELKRVLEWQRFSAAVENHVIEYTIPQYGDYPNDQATKFTPEDLITQIKRYANRFGKNARGPVEEQRDMLKIAHYACLIHSKLKEKLQ